MCRSRWTALLFLALVGCPSGPGRAPDPDEAALARATGLVPAQLQRLRREARLSERDLREIAPDRLRRMLEKLDHPKPDHPGEAARFRRRQRLGEDGTIPPNGLVEAKRQRDALIEALSGEDTGGITPAGWTWLGPGNIGGRTRAILVHPTQTGTLWLGSVGGGIWKSTDGGQSWFALNDFMVNLAVGCMALDPTNPSVLYAGTGEGFFNNDAVAGAGVFRSTDGGATWSQLPSTSGPAWNYVNRLALDPTRPQTILAATNSGIYRSTDAGATWTQCTASRTLDVKYHPTDGTRAVAGQGDGAALFSTNGGASWEVAEGIPTGGWLSRAELAYARSAPDTVYASIASYPGPSPGLYRSTDGGATYFLRNGSTNYLSSQGWYDNLVWVDPTNAAVVVVGGIDLWRSTDAGQSLLRISDWMRAPASAHADHHLLVAHPEYNGTTNRTVYSGNDGGIYRAADLHAVSPTSGWLELNNNLGITQFYGGAVNATTGVVLGGTQDNGTLRGTGGTETWSTTFGGDGGFCAADPVASNYFYGEYVLCQIHRSTNGGLSANYIIGGPNPLADAGNAAEFIAPFVLDPNEPNRLLAGAARLWRTNNVRASVPDWFPIKPSTGSHISAIAVAEGNPDVVWVGHGNGDVYKTVNGTAATPTWTKMDGNAPGLPNRWCSRIAIDRADANRVYVTFMGFAPDNVWRTQNGGAGWTSIPGALPGRLPSVPVTSIALHRRAAGWLYVGTDVGVFASTNDGASWSTSNDGPANVAVDELIWKGDRTLIAVTHGRGMFQADAGPSGLPADGTIGGSCQRASVSSTGVQGNGWSAPGGISADGRFVGFHSEATTLVPGDTNGRHDVFVMDRATGQVTRVSVSSAGVQGNMDSYMGRLSADGRFVAMHSEANNLVTGDTNIAMDVFIRDRQAPGQTTRVSVATGGAQANGASYLPHLSADGRFVAFQSDATNLVPNDTNGSSDIFVHDRLLGQTTLVSVGTGGVPANGRSEEPWLSADGSLVAFASEATNLVTGDANGRKDAFVRNRLTNVTTRVSVPSGPGESNGISENPSISADGTVVAFESGATNLVPGDNNAASDVFVRDLRMLTTSMTSVTPAGAPGNGRSSLASVSGDGLFVLFSSYATNLVPGDTNATFDNFVRDRLTGATSRVSVDSAGGQGNFGTGESYLSADGRHAAMYSYASNLVTGDTNGVEDALVRDLFPWITTSGTPSVGSTVALNLCAPDHAGKVFQIATALGYLPGIPVVNSWTLPLNPDPFFYLSMLLPSAFQGYSGVLGATGLASAAIRLPAEPALAGLMLSTAFVAFDPAQPSGIGAISNARRLTIVP
jgi:Tol biopolymer transport system component